MRGAAEEHQRVRAALTCRQVDGQELLTAQHGHGAGGEAPQHVHVGGQVEEGKVAEGGEDHGRAQRPCRRSRRRRLTKQKEEVAVVTEAYWRRGWT